MFIDFQDVKKNHPIDKVAERLGLKLTRHQHMLRGKCPSGQGNERALVITPDKGVWYSFAKDTGGDVIALVAFVKGIETKEAAAWIVSGDEAPQAESQGFQELSYLDAEHASVFAIGMNEEAAKALGIGYAPKGVLRGTVAFPIRHKDGRLAGYIGVTEAKLPPKWEL